MQDLYQRPLMKVLLLGSKRYAINYILLVYDLMA